MVNKTNLLCFLPRLNKNFLIIQQYLLFLLFLFFLINCNPVEKQVQENKIKFTAKEIYKNNVFNTVTIITHDGIGSGFFIDSNKVVTNYHVIAKMNTAEIILNNSDKRYPVIGYLSVDKMNDLVLLQVDYNNKSWISIENSLPQPGENVFAIGSPIGLSKTISEGIVSGIRNFNDKKLLQITTPISHGSSGSPIFNESGKLIGVAVGGIEEGNNIGFCIPSILVNSLLDFREQFTRSIDQLATNESQTEKKSEPQKSDEIKSSISSESLIDKRYLGKHLFSCHLIGETHTFGTVTIEQKNGNYTINGGQKNKDGDWIMIFGKIEILDIDNFIFYGTIKVHNPSYAENGEPAYCEWSGAAPFKLYRDYLYNSGKDYWRRLPGTYGHYIDQPCVSLTGAIDILLN